MVACMKIQPSFLAVFHMILDTIIYFHSFRILFGVFLDMYPLNVLHIEIYPPNHVYCWYTLQII